MEDRRRILIIFAHPAIRRSRCNRRLIAAAGGLEDVTIHDLYQSYPEFDIDIAHEQQLLDEHDVVVFQHPFYWYSTPAILKEWQDLVLEHGWAYGAGGDALAGKLVLNVVTAGGGEESYSHDGYNRLTVRQLLAPIEATARLCGMDFLPPFVIHGTHSLEDSELSSHITDYRRTLEALRGGSLDLKRVRGLARINGNLDAVIGS